MLLLRSLLFNLFTFGLMPFYGILLSPIALWSREGAYWVMKLYSRHVLTMLRVLCGTRFEIRGRVPQEEVILAAKHQSFIDMVLIMHVVERPRYISKKELQYTPFLGQYALRIDTIMVDRGKKGAAVRSMTEHVARQRAQGVKGPIVIFPQGTRVKPAVKHPYKIGVWRLYQALAVPCVPAATNTGLFWGRHTVRRYPGTMVLEFLDPIEPGMAADSFMADLEARVEAASDRLNAEAGFPNGRA